MRPLTRAVPKVLLPVGRRAAIDYPLDECEACGIHEVAIVWNPRHMAVRTYLEGRTGKARITFLPQPDPNGLGDAIARAETFVAGRPFAVLLPDNVFFAKEPPLAQLLRARDGREGDWIGLVRIGKKEAAGFGNCGSVRLGRPDGPVVPVKRVGGKRRGAFRVDGAPVWRAIGREVYDGDCFDLLRELRPARKEAFDDVTLHQRLAREGRLSGVRLDAEAYDVGNWTGWARGNLRAAEEEGWA